MKWDKRLAVFAMLGIVAAAAVLFGIVYFTIGRINDSSDRIVGKSEDGYSRFVECLDGDLIRSNITRRGKFESQRKYASFSLDLLAETECTDASFLKESIEYTHVVKLIFSTTKGSEKEATLFKNDEIYYVGFIEGKNEYRFEMTCPSLTDWFDKINDMRID